MSCGHCCCEPQAGSPPLMGSGAKAAWRLSFYFLLCLPPPTPGPGLTSQPPASVAIHPGLWVFLSTGSWQVVRDLNQHLASKAKQTKHFLKAFLIQQKLSSHWCESLQMQAAVWEVIIRVRTTAWCGDWGVQAGWAERETLHYHHLNPQTAISQPVLISCNDHVPLQLATEIDIFTANLISLLIF